MTAEQIIAQAKARREKLVFLIPSDQNSEERLFDCYPKDADQKAKWLASAARKGWTLQ